MSKAALLPAGPLTGGQWLARAEEHLARAGVSEARANAEFLLAAALKRGRGEVLVDRGRPVAAKDAERFWHLVHLRSKRVPLAYVLGNQPFLGHDIEVSRAVLIPRPETEELVVAAAGLFKGRAGEPLQILEIGTGTGCVAIALSALLPNAVVYATDVSQDALRLAEKNALKAGVLGRVRLVREDLFKPAGALVSPGWADLVVSNPPYIPTAELKDLEPEVLEEPHLALDGGPDGLDALRAIVAESPRRLKRGGRLALEFGMGQGPALLALLAAAGFSEAMLRRDAQGVERLALAKW